MPLPDLIEIVPLDKPVRAEITVPGSKSITNRALVLAALGEGETTLQGALWSEDTQVMVECLQELGFMVNVEADPQEPCNRTITVYGKGGLGPAGRHGSAAVGTVCGQCRHRGAVSGGIGLPGQGRLSAARRAANARAAAGGAVPGAARAGLSDRVAQRQIAGADSRRRPARGQVPGEHRGEFAVCLGAAALCATLANGRWRCRGKMRRSRRMWR